jgi:hypothetical protein
LAEVYHPEPRQLVKELRYNPAPRHMESKYTAKSLSEFSELAATFRDRWFRQEPTWGPWFRGQRSTNWSLQPTFYRYSSERQREDLDDEIRQEFTMRAPGLGLTLRPQNAWEWYFLMQHSGAPTRLLDWTEGALIALYFAVRDHDDEDGDAAVWILEPYELNKRVVGTGEVIPPGDHEGISKEHQKRYAPWLRPRYTKRGKMPDLPVAVYPNYIAPRISTQRSCFTIHGSDPNGMEGFANGDDPCVAKVNIAGSACRKIREQLVVSGIDEVTIFPDLDGLGRLLTTVLKIEAANEHLDVFKVPR